MKDPTKHATEWPLTENALKTLKTEIDEGVFNDAKAIYSSDESKAIQTAIPIATHLQLETRIEPNFAEVKRSKEFLSNEAFLEKKKKQLEDLEYKTTPDEESGNEAYERFIETIQHIESTHPEKTVVIVSHGTILSIYFAKLLNKEVELFDRWSRLSFCAIGVVEDGVVTRDIAS